MFNFYLTYKVSYPRSWLLLDVLLHTSFDNSKSHFEKKKKSLNVLHKMSVNFSGKHVIRAAVISKLLKV